MKWKTGSRTQDSPASYSYFLDNAFIPKLARGSKGAVTNWKSMNPIIMGRFSCRVRPSTESLKPNDENNERLLMKRVNRVKVKNK